MAPSATHRGWLLDKGAGILAAVYNGAQEGTVLLATNTALDGVLLGTPVTPALAVDSLVISNLVASGDILIAANNGGNSQAWLWVDASAGTMTLYGAGTAASVISSTALEVEDNILLALGNDQDVVLVNRSTILNANTALTGVLIGTPVTPAVAANSLILANATASGDILVAVNEGGNSQAYLWIDTSAAEMRLYGSGTLNVIHTSGVVTVEDDVLLAVGTGSTARFSYDTTDANANAMLLQLPAGGATDVPVIAIGQSIESVDLGLYNGVVDPRIAMFGVGAVATGPMIEFRKARGTIASPTVVTTADDLGSLDFYGAVAAGEYVRAARILVEMTGTIATTRGPGVITFQTATDAAPSVLTTALTISAAQLVTVAAGLTVTTGNLTFSAAADIVMAAATAAALEISDGTTKFYAVDTRVATAGVTSHTLDVGDYTFASAAGNVAIALSLAAHTLNYTGATQVTTAVTTVSIGGRTIAGDTATLTVDQANTLRLIAPVEGTNVAITAASAIRIADAGGTPVNQYGIYIEALTAGATADYAIWVAGASPVHLGTAGTAAGTLEIDGSTSGTLTIIAGASTTSHTMTMPPTANTNAGYQLTCAGADTITSWGAAASRRELKDIQGRHDAQDALDKILSTRVYDFRYKPGKGTQDGKTDYVGVMADEAPWAMHYEGGVVNPVNTFGYTVLGFQAMAEKIKQLESKLAALAA